jgi:hypothetical protein
LFHRLWIIFFRLWFWLWLVTAWHNLSDGGKLGQKLLELSGRVAGGYGAATALTV